MTSIIPYLVSFFAVASYALMGPIAKKVSTDLQPLSFIAVTSFLLMMAAAISSYFFEKGALASFEKINPQWLVIYFVCNFVSYIGYLWAITRIPVAQFEMFGIFVPIIGGFFAWLILNETFHTRYFVALAFMAVGIFIAVAPDLLKKN